VIPAGPLQEITTLATGEFELGALALVRIASMVVLMPVLGSVSVPATVRIGLSAALTICVFPTLARTGVHLPESVFGFAALALREMLVGILAGWVFSLVFQVTELAGAVIDMQAGYSMVELFDPTTGESTHLFGQFLGIAATVAFLAGGGHAHLVAALADSFRAVPLGQARFDAAKILPHAISLTGNAVLLGFQMAGPVLMALLMVCLLMAVVSRIMPSANTWVLAMPLQIMTACAVTALSLPHILGAFRGWQDGIWQASGNLLGTMR
jgi:flagellar biosynthetic protein FliR